MSPGNHTDHVVVIQPSKGWVRLGLGELWQYRDLLVAWVTRDIKIRYKQTLLGVAWAVLQPLIAMLLFTVVFGRLAKIDSEGVPYSIFAYSALVPWYYFANALTQTSLVLVGQQHIITKIYFPRLVLPLSCLFSGLVDFFINLCFLLIVMIFMGFAPSTNILLLPLLLLVAMGTAFGVGLWLSAMHVLYRDVRFLVPFLVQMWLFATPVVYPSSTVPEQWRPLVGLNPMAGVIEGFRWVLVGTPAPDPRMMAISCVMVVLLCVSGLWFFRQVERTMADRV